MTSYDPRRVHLMDGFARSGLRVRGSSADAAPALAERSAAFLAAARPALSELAGVLGKAHQAADQAVPGR
jgi:hypothetical protein